jgi:predicted ATP-grasp superfamily ATP-dependent carboligase
MLRLPLVRVLVTISRFPHALAEIRHFGEEGHEVYAADTFSTAPGNHSKHVVEAFVLPSPTFDTDAFIAALHETIRSRGIDLVVPAFEEALYIAEHLPELSAITDVFCSPLAALTKLHDKSAFVQLGKELGLPVPATCIARSQAELVSALREFPEYIGRPVFSRGGVTLLTNTGPLRGRVAVENCFPTPEQPWIVQEFVHGTEVCSFSVAQRGLVVAHCAYEHPKTIEHAGGIVFESIDEPESVAIAQRCVEALDYHGQISFVFVRTERGLTLLECNPRPTAGVLMMGSHEFVDAVLRKEPRSPTIVPKGVRRQIGVAIARDMIRSWREIPHDLELLFSGTEDAYVRRGDAMPALYCLLAYEHVREFRRQMHLTRHDPTDLVAAQFYDVLWDGARKALT